MLRTGSVAHLNSRVPTAVEARKGVKEKYEFGETMVTGVSGPQQVMHIVYTPSYSDLSTLLQGQAW